MQTNSERLASHFTNDKPEAYRQGYSDALSDTRDYLRTSALHTVDTREQTMSLIARDYDHGEDAYLAQMTGAIYLPTVLNIIAELFENPEELAQAMITAARHHDEAEVATDKQVAHIADFLDTIFGKSE